MRLYDIFMEHNITQFRTQSQILGVKDSINTRFVEESRGDNAVKAKMAALDLNYPTRLYNPFLRLEGLADWIISHCSVLALLTWRFA
jgi:hypothetical protein